MSNLAARLARLERRPGPADRWDDCSFWDEQADSTWVNESTDERLTTAELDRRPEHVVMVARPEEVTNE